MAVPRPPYSPAALHAARSVGWPAAPAVDPGWPGRSRAWRLAKNTKKMDISMDWFKGKFTGNPHI